MLQFLAGSPCLELGLHNKPGVETWLLAEHRRLFVMPPHSWMQRMFVSRMSGGMIEHVQIQV